MHVQNDLLADPGMLCGLLAVPGQLGSINAVFARVFFFFFFQDFFTGIISIHS